MKSKIKILSMPIVIEFVPNFNELEGTEDAVALWRAALNRIQIINKGLDNGFAFEAMCHEIVEAWNDKMGLTLPHNTITALGTALAVFLRENKLVGKEWE